MEEIVRSKGKFIMVYGKTGVGKSTSSIATLPRPILDIFVEDKDPYSSIEALESLPEPIIIGDDIRFFKPSNDAELVKSLRDILANVNEGKFRYKSIMFDTASMWMNIKLIEDFLDERVRTETSQTNRPLVEEVKVTLAMYGAIARRMIRITKWFQMISQKGIVVNWIAQAMDTPKWNMELAYAPNFIGQEYNKQFEQFFDAIGLIESRCDKNGREIYPPIISFKSPNNNFTAKWSGRHLKHYTALFDFSKILQLGSNVEQGEREQDDNKQDDDEMVGKDEEG